MQRITTQRKNILEIVKRLGHSTLSEIASTLRKDCPHAALSTVYRSLETLEKEKVIRRVPAKYGPDFYESYDQAKHDHFICLRCGKIYDIPKRRTKMTPLSKEGNYVQEVVTTYYGECRECVEKDN